MTKETQTQAIAEPFKFKNAALLNRLSEMAQVPYYATACHTLIQAEMAIVELERENATLRAEVERLAAQSAPTGLTEMGWIIDAATKGELAAYDQGCDECQQAVTKILDGKDTGAGTANAPWELLRRRLLALVAQSAPLQQAECTCAAKDMPFGRCCRAAAQVEPAELTNDQITAGYLAMLESIEVVGMDRAVQRFRDAVSKGDHQ